MSTAPSDTSVNSPLYRLIDAQLTVRGTSLEQVVTTSREARQSWRTLAAELEQMTGVHVSWETLRLWFADRLVVDVTVRLADRVPTAELERVA